MMKIMLYCPLYPAKPRIHDATLTSIEELAWKDNLTIVYQREDMPAELGYANILRKYQLGRQLALDGGFDALFCVESDMIVPPLALERLSMLECDVACGLYISRHSTRRWLAMTHLDRCRGKSLSESPELARQLWGCAKVTVGAGLGCTLIHRRVLEAIPFRKEEGGAACDWAFAWDCQEAGMRTMHDLGVVCGHITGEGGVLWPDINAENLYREGTYIERSHMAKYQAINLLWSASLERYVEPGEVIELNDEAGRILMESGNVKPAEVELKEEIPQESRKHKRVVVLMGEPPVDTKSEDGSDPS